MIVNQLGGLSPCFILVRQFLFYMFVIRVLFVVIIIPLDKKNEKVFNKIREFYRVYIILGVSVKNGKENLFLAKINSHTRHWSNDRSVCSQW